MFVYYFVCLREVKNQLPSNGGQSLDDFVLMTSFPQRRISDMENTLESAGELIDYIQILLTDFHGFYIIHLEVCIRPFPVMFRFTVFSQHMIYVRMVNLERL